MPALEEVKAFLNIDFDDDDAELERAIRLTKEWLMGALGYEPVEGENERAKQLQLFMIEDIYDRNGGTQKENAVLERMKKDFILQLQLENRQEG